MRRAFPEHPVRHAGFARFVVLATFLTAAVAAPAAQQQGPVPAPDRRPGEGLGPFKTMVIRGATLIDGTGAPPTGPVDIVIEGNRIVSVRSAGPPGLPMAANRPPLDADHEIDARGMYVMPGFVDLHAHAGGAPKNAEAEYAYKLWLAHGVTTVRGVPLASNAFTVAEKARSARNDIVAPRIFNCQRPGAVATPAEARAWVQRAAADGIDCLKLGAYEPAIMAALNDEAHKHGMGTTAHLQQGGIAQMNALDAARAGLDTVTHFYGHFEALLKDTVVQDWPADINAADEQWRFGQAARLWNQIHAPGSPEWKAYLEEHLKLGTVFDNTLGIYVASRDVMRAREAEWHDQYTLPSLMDYFTPSRAVHGSYWFNWTTHDEVAWKNLYQIWFRLVNDYKKMGGRITTGSDSGFIYQTYGFGFINELEMLQEAGFHPLEVIQAATMNGALTLSEHRPEPVQFGIVKAGKLADLVIVDQNPLANFKVLYGTGAVKLNDDTGKVERVGGIKWTIKDGIAYDAKQLLADVAKMVEKQKAERAAAQAAPAQAHRDVHPHASVTVASHAHSTGIYGFEHPSDWQVHERGLRTHIGTSDGLEATERGFRTVYGAFVAIIDRPEAAASLTEAATRAVESILSRNPHQKLLTPVRLDGSVAGRPAASAVITGISPVTGRGERAEIIIGEYGASQLLYVMLVSPTEHFSTLREPLQRFRDSVWVRLPKTP